MNISYSITQYFHISKLERIPNKDNLSFCKTEGEYKFWCLHTCRLIDDNDIERSSLYLSCKMKSIESKSNNMWSIFDSPFFHPIIITITIYMCTICGSISVHPMIITIVIGIHSITMLIPCRGITSIRYSKVPFYNCLITQCSRTHSRDNARLKTRMNVGRRCINTDLLISIRINLDKSLKRHLASLI